MDYVRIDCLAALLFAARVLADAAAEAEMTPAIRARFEKLHPDLARVTKASIGTQTEAADRLQRVLNGWETTYRKSAT